MERNIEANEKELKQQKNLKIKQPKDNLGASRKPKHNVPRTNAQNAHMPDVELTPSFVRIRELFKKTEEMKAVASEKNREVEHQFQYLKERLNGSTIFLDRMKTSIENLKFTYQKNASDLDKQFNAASQIDSEDKQFQNKEQMNTYLDEIKHKIVKLQARQPSTYNEKDNSNAPNYQSAFEDVVKNLQKIDKGLCAAENFANGE